MVDWLSQVFALPSPPSSLVVSKVRTGPGSVGEQVQAVQFEMCTGTASSGLRSNRFEPVLGGVQYESHYVSLEIRFQSKEIIHVQWHVLQRYIPHRFVESKRERTKKLNCLSIQREEKL